MSDCIFCRIVAGTLPARVLWENDHAIAFLGLFLGRVNQERDRVGLMGPIISTMTDPL